MTVAELMEALCRMPSHAPVLIAQCTFNESSGGNLEFSDEPATVATWEGNHVLLRSDASP